ncbi:MAG: ECF-type sigma factor [Planctomycetota bacterium]|nr:ECF-type sigma factor [Planctomycetota bacterium]
MNSPPASDSGASGERPLLPDVYQHLHAIARARMVEERAGHTLQATALVHEAWLRLSKREGGVDGIPDASFYEAAAIAMRRILIEHARSKGRLKRGGDRERTPIDVVDLAAEHDPDEILAVEDAVRRLEAEDPDAARVVNLRFFAGLDVAETARALGISERTVAREWEYARAWLYRVLHDAHTD